MLKTIAKVLVTLATWVAVTIVLVTVATFGGIALGLAVLKLARML